MDALLIYWICTDGVSVILSFVVLILLKRAKRFEHSFYFCVRYTICLNLLCHFNTWPHRLKYRPESEAFLLPIERHAKILLTVSTALLTVFFHIQSLSTVVICAHRLSIALSIHANRFWTKWYRVVYIFIVIISCLSILITYTPVMYWDKKKKQFAHYSIPQDEFDRMNFIRGISMGAYFWVISIIGVITYYKIKCRLSQQSDLHKSTLCRLTLITMYHTSAYSLFLLWQLLTFFLKTYWSNDFMLSVSDIVTFSMTFIILVLDKQVDDFWQKMKIAFFAPTSIAPSRSTFLPTII